MNYAVGQGGFYAGQIGDNFNFIYDCGASKPKGSLETAIDNYISKFNKTNIIDLLILSHFDYDHISGVPILIKKNNFTIKKLVIPYLGPKSFLFWEFIFHFYSINLEKIEEIILIMNDDNYSDEDDNDNDNNDNYKRITVSNQFMKIANVIKNQKLPIVAWNFKFFNTSNLKGIDSMIKKLEENLSNALSKSGKVNSTDKISAIDILKILGLNEIKKIYELSFENKNKNNISLCLYHSPFNRLVQEVQVTHGIFYNTKLNNFNKLMTHSTVGTLLTGDFSFKTKKRYNEFLTWFSSIYNVNSDILFMDLPHHGSKYNWNNDFLRHLNKDRVYIFGNASISNNYHHPSPEVIEAIRNQQIIYLQCDDNNFLSYTLKL